MSYPTPAEIDWPRLERFLGFCWRLGLLHNGSITSGARTAKRNRAVGGHPESRHTYEHGWAGAVDFVFDSPTDRTLALKAVHDEGYHPYIGSNYDSLRLHVQIVPPGEELSL